MDSGTNLSATSPVTSMRLRIASSVAVLVLLLILLQSIVTLMLVDEKEEESIEAMLGQQISYSMSVWPENPAAAYPNTPNMHLYRQEKKEEASGGVLPERLRKLAVGNHEIREDGREFHMAVREDALARYVLVYDVQEHEKRLNDVMLMTVTAAFILASLALAVGYGLAGRLSARLERLAGRVATHADQGSLVEPGMASELLAVAEALDAYRQHQAAMLDRERAFAANLAHELRTPLTAIRTDAELLAALPGLPESVTRRGNRIMGSVDRINRLSNSLLLLAREAKPALLEEIHLAATVEAVWQALVLQRGVNAAWALEVPSSARLQADPALFELVVRNILENALRHSAAGEIGCHLDGARLIFMDTGPGFEEADLPRVFERFYSGAQGEHGLGLALVKHVCQATGWKVDASNRPQGGAQIILDLGLGVSCS